MPMFIRYFKFLSAATVAILFIGLPLNSYGAEDAYPFNYLNNGKGITLPEDTPPGTVLGRDFIDLTPICEDEFKAGHACVFKSISIRPKGYGTEVTSDGDIPTTVPGISLRLLFNGEKQGSLTSNQYPVSTFNRFIEAVLVKNGDEIQEGSLDSDLGGLSPLFYHRYYASICESSADKCMNIYLWNVKVKLIKRACILRNSFVVLPKAKLSDLGSEGATTGEVNFSLNFDCPAGYHHVFYSFRPIGNSTEVITGAKNGLLPASPESTTQGIAIQLLDAKTREPIRWGYGKDDIYPLDYDASRPGYTFVSLIARYYQKWSGATGGQIKAVTEILMNYD
ncbi:hypothetical protein BWP39_09880 [Paraburkholderia acidicola]|uniref:Fimbrial-type adhesion domain-containing protein n=1 Tax=Paraburkholderia acidicola TaxID=1912599 RepID=A0A2A4F1W2_9BURK|nr:fimbrial protein [Paraburkholderia acidicola]PCE27085.1 hypothetical protein BWP39_09880 [Paraburkholderia acidicola]